MGLLLLFAGAQGVTVTPPATPVDTGGPIAHPPRHPRNILHVQRWREERFADDDLVALIAAGFLL